MYEALGSRDIDSILKAPELKQPEPKDPAQENVDVLDNTELKAFEGQAHDAHIMAHITFMAGGMVQQMSNVVVSLQKHVLEHIKLKSREQAAIQFVQENQGQPVTEDQMLQIEAMTAQIIAQEITAVRQLSQQIAGGGGEEPAPDPLIALKEKEIDIKGQKTQADIGIDQGKLDLEGKKMTERSRQFDDRLGSQEKQTTQRIRASDRRENMRLRQKAGETP
jgi:hypothetical protein